MNLNVLTGPHRQLGCAVVPQQDPFSALPSYIGLGNPALSAVRPPAPPPTRVLLVLASNRDALASANGDWVGILGGVVLNNSEKHTRH
jgi:hypothetical protein